MDKRPDQSSLYPEHPNVPQCPQPEAYPIKGIDRTACPGGISLPSPRESGGALEVEGERFIPPIFLSCCLPGSSRNLPGGPRARLFLSTATGFISKVFSPGSHWEAKSPLPAANQGSLANDPLSYRAPWHCQEGGHVPAQAPAWHRASCPTDPMQGRCFSCTYLSLRPSPLSSLSPACHVEPRCLL